MPLSDEVRKKIFNLVNDKKESALLDYLEELLKAEKINIKDLYEYAKYWVLSKQKDAPYALSPDIINEIGVKIANLENKDISKYAVLFWFLSANRGCSWGCANYAVILLDGDLIEKSEKKALAYAQKAVDLTKNSKTEMHQHKDILAMALLADGKRSEGKHSRDCTQFFKKQITSEKPPVPVLTREQGHQDLKYVYGGASDSEGEEYASDLSFN